MSNEEQHKELDHHEGCAGDRPRTHLVDLNQPMTATLERAREAQRAADVAAAEAGRPSTPVKVKTAASCALFTHTSDGELALLLVTLDKSKAGTADEERVNYHGADASPGGKGQVGDLEAGKEEEREGRALGAGERALLREIEEELANIIPRAVLLAALDDPETVVIRNKSWSGFPSPRVIMYIPNLQTYVDLFESSVDPVVKAAGGVSRARLVSWSSFLGAALANRARLLDDSISPRDRCVALHGFLLADYACRDFVWSNQAVEFSLGLAERFAKRRPASRV